MARQLPRGNQSEQQTAGARRRQREPEREEVQAWRVDTRKRLSDDAAERRHGGRRHEDAGRAAKQSEHGGLDEELTAKAPGGRAHGGADRELPSAVAGAREEQVGDIRAGDEEHQSDGAEHREHNRPCVADEIVFDRQHPQRPAR